MLRIMYHGYDWFWSVCESVGGSKELKSPARLCTRIHELQCNKLWTNCCTGHNLNIHARQLQLELYNTILMQWQCPHSAQTSILLDYWYGTCQRIVHLTSCFAQSSVACLWGGLSSARRSCLPSPSCAQGPDSPILCVTLVTECIFYSCPPGYGTDYTSFCHSENIVCT